jgi:hypothetical protein
VIPWECVVPQHKLVIADFCFRIRLQGSKRVQAPRTKWWKLKEDVVRTFKERVLKKGLGMKEVMQIACGWGCPLALKMALEEFGVTKWGKHEAK